jgi:hypothetical protein
MTAGIVGAENDVPLWAALLTGLLGGVIGTLATINHERGAEFRTRMLTAADEYFQAFGLAMSRALDLELKLIPNDDETDLAERLSKEELDKAFREVDEMVEDAELKLVRLNLLFDGLSGTYQTAAAGLSALSEDVEAARRLRAGEPREVRRGSVLDMDDFPKHVRRDVRAVGSLIPSFLRRRAD